MTNLRPLARLASAGVAAILLTSGLVALTGPTSAVPPSQNTLVDTVNAVPTPTTTTLTLPASVEYGATFVAIADVATTGTNAKPAGKVTFTFEGTSVTVDAKGGRAKATLGPASVMGTGTVTAVFTPTDTNLAASQATKSIRVVKDQTTTTATAVYRAATERLVGKARVESQHGSEVAGVVRFVLKRDGVRIRSALVELNRFDKARKAFKNVSKHGLYTVVARYLGSPTLKRSVDRVRITV